MDNRFEVTVGAGTMRSGSGAAVRFPHRWPPAASLLRPISLARICCILRRPTAS